ncbi:MCE family protein [Nocardioides sp. HM23]|uniref:MCE family protein n=1 Tax=Nocardioides bizhenqiangii TaxID=3095076 RepID=UPI002ACAE5E3|nr:MCE family protein [Nocardioides sp. HM23]MDZ5620501.1 MCE family protein [Nocardioides sp. HM23]
MTGRGNERVTVTVVDDATRGGAPGLARPVRLALLAVVLMMASACSALPGSSGGRMEVVAYFEDSAGLFVGNDVGILGVPVGEITSIDPDGEQVKVTMEIDDDHQVPADAGAVVIARSVATDRYVELTPVYSKGPTLEDGDEIPIDRTRAPVDFDQVLASLNDFATGIASSKKATKAIERFVDQGTEALRGNGPLINQTIHALQEGVSGIHAQRGSITSTLRSLDVLLAAVSANESTAREFIRRVTEAADLLADERENFATALRSLDDAVTVVAEFAVDNRDQIVEAVNGSTRLMRTILQKQRNLTEILRVMPLTLQNLQRARIGDRIPVTFDPVVLTPLGKTINQVCDRLPPAICQLFGTDPLGGN